MSSYSPIFTHNLRLRATAYLAKSMSLTSSNTHSLLHSRFQFSGQNSVFSRHIPSPHHYVLRKRTGLAFNNFAWLAAGSSSSSSPSSVLKLIRKHASSTSSLSKLPHFYQQSSGYGRFAYDDYVSEDEEYESDNNGSSQQMVSSLSKSGFCQLALWELFCSVPPKSDLHFGFS